MLVAYAKLLGDIFAPMCEHCLYTRSLVPSFDFAMICSLASIEVFLFFFSTACFPLCVVSHESSTKTRRLQPG